MEKSGHKAPHQVSGPIRPQHEKGIGYHRGRAIHGSNPTIHTVERKLGPPKAHKPSAPHAKSPHERPGEFRRGTKNSKPVIG
jgi:hypothetical protein